MNYSKSIQDKFNQSLKNIRGFSECALLDYPNYLNLGDHLIWLGNLTYLHAHNIRIRYAASCSEFNNEDLRHAAGDAPILLSGGGSFGDIWHGLQKFRERIIQQYRDRPIVILPQTLYFQDPKKLKQAADIFNNHPNLSIFVRDTISYAMAQQTFDRCRIYLAPDAAFQLTAFNDFPVRVPRNKILFHCRTDKELSARLHLDPLPLPVEVSDWRAYEEQWRMGSPHSRSQQKLASLFRATWQRGPRHFAEWRSRYRWERQFAPSPMLKAVYNPMRQRQSWSFVHSAVYQFRQYRLIVTNRLHGHILATLLGIPHVFMPNSYHKNEAFYKTWTSEIPYCRFVFNSQDINFAVKELLNTYG